MKWQPSHGGYRTSQGHTRPNKLAAGMMETLYRHKRGHSEVANTLAVCGTTDEIRALHWRTERSSDKCPCCGGPRGLLRLNQRGRLHLAHVRRMREKWGNVDKRRPLETVALVEAMIAMGYADAD